MITNDQELSDAHVDNVDDTSRLVCNADNERFGAASAPKTDDVKRTVNGCKVGDFVEMMLPCGDSIVCKLEYIEKGIAGIRLKNFAMFKVSDELVMPTTMTKCYLPDWSKCLLFDLSKELHLEILLGYRKDVEDKNVEE